VGIIGESRTPVAAPELMAANVVDGFFLGAVLIDLPWEKLVECMCICGSNRETRLGKLFSPIVGENQRGGGFIAVVKGGVSRSVSSRDVLVVLIRLLIALEMIPSAEDDPAETIHAWRKRSRGSVVEHEQIAGCRIERPDSRDDRGLFVLVQLRVQVSLAV